MSSIPLLFSSTWIKPVKIESWHEQSVPCVCQCEREREHAFLRYLNSVFVLSFKRSFPSRICNKRINMYVQLEIDDCIYFVKNTRTILCLVKNSRSKIHTSICYAYWLTKTNYTWVCLEVRTLYRVEIVHNTV